MKTSPFILFESETALQNIAISLRNARLLRGDSQQTAAARIGASLSTYQRIESGDPQTMAGITVCTLLNALVVYGHASGVLALGNTDNDADRRLLTQPTRQRGRTIRLTKANPMTFSTK